MKPQSHNYEFHQEGGRYSVVMPVRRRWSMIVVITLWLVGWLSGVGIGTGLWVRGTATADPFLLGWFAFAYVFSALVVVCLLWSLFGREIVELDSTGLRFGRAIGPVGRTWRFGTNEVLNLRKSYALPRFWDPWSGLVFLGLAGGPLALDCGKKTFRFGRGLEDVQVDSLFDQLQNAFQRLGFGHLGGCARP
ncbi:MAG: hypothetical protein AB1566_15435 [Chloroflexota bacterium]